jgi:CheY-like chemotaxis protein
MLRAAWIVDDDESYRELLALVLETHCGVGCVHGFPGGADLLRAFAALGTAPAPALVLLDFHMPGMQAPQVLRALRERCVEVPVVVLSGAASPEERERCLAEGALAFLDKPARSEDLIRLLRELTTTPGAGTAGRRVPS